MTGVGRCLCPRFREGRGDLKALLKTIDATSEWSGKLVALMFYAMVGVLVWEVVVRYAFNAPTIWAHGISVRIFAAYAILAGAYVLLHKGHIEYLKNAKALGDKLIVGVLTDAAVMEKKSKPIMSFDERFDLVRSLRWVDMVVAQSTYSPLENVMALRPDILVETTDHEKQSANDFIESIGGRVLTMPYYPNHSSTKIKDEIKK